MRHNYTRVLQSGARVNGGAKHKGFVGFHMLAVPDDIGSKDYCNLTINLLFRHTRILIAPRNDYMLRKFSPTKDMEKIMSRGRNAPIRSKNGQAF